MTLRAAVYAPYSDEIQNPCSIEDQVSLCRKDAEAQGWPVNEIYADAAMTGRTANRPEFNRIRKDAADTVFDVVIVEAVKRFSRRVVDSLQQRELLTFSGVKLVSVSEGEQNFLNVMLNALGAQMFSEKIADHTRPGLVGALEREGRMHSLAYGYRKVEGQMGVREIDRETAPIVLSIFQEAADGRSGDDIARGLNRVGIPAPQGGIWYASTIRGGSTRASTGSPCGNITNGQDRTKHGTDFLFDRGHSGEQVSSDAIFAEAGCGGLNPPRFQLSFVR
ncbi:recombinase family protein [Maribius pontilimi]|uniref:Recombinase family protein n=1 Tax=Palleronia pontilimi TaxID=1964209 RepID=A0A934MDL7_9RHOB|nr:recombinase family protein [Palleronia pontilimi]MBJ3762511.1 recombinase family protein [Palleronia pontilimi]